MADTTNGKVHPFEQAGLGAAPFRFVGCYEDRGPKIISVANGVTHQVGAPGQPMGTCSYCGQGIAICCEILSADGKRFIVGSDCVNRTHQEGTRVRSDAERAVRSMKAEAKRAKFRELLAAGRDRLANDEGLRARLASLPSPNEYRASKGDTRLNWAEWMLANAGTNGRTEVLNYIKSVGETPRRERNEEDFMDDPEYHARRLRGDFDFRDERGVWHLE